MAVTVADILAVMKDAGLAPAIEGRIKPDIPLAQQGLDSMDMPIIAIATEKKFGIDLSDADSLNVRTVNDFVDFVNRKLK